MAVNSHYPVVITFRDLLLSPKPKLREKLRYLFVVVVQQSLFLRHLFNGMTQIHQG